MADNHYCPKHMNHCTKVIFGADTGWKIRVWKDPFGSTPNMIPIGQQLLEMNVLTLK